MVFEWNCFFVTFECIEGFLAAQSTPPVLKVLCQSGKRLLAIVFPFTWDRRGGRGHMGDNGSSKWVTKRCHVQVSRTDVVPVIFRSKKVGSGGGDASESEQSSGRPVARAFARTEYQLSDCVHTVKKWLWEHLERVYRVGGINDKAGALEAAHVLRDGSQQLTVWVEPTEACAGVVVPMGDSRFECFSTTAQSLHVTAQRCE
ncbi:unnamed protein product [Agarophyton chilense]